VRFFLGTAYEAKGMPREAEQEFRAIPESSPVYRDAMLHVAMSLGRQDRIDEAIGVTEKLREKFPDDVPLLIYLGTQLEEAKRYQEALDVLKEAAQKDPESASARFSLGVVYDKLGNLDMLISSMEKAIELDAGHATAMNYLGYTYADRNMRLAEAESLILRALAIRPDDGYFIDSLAWVYYRKGDYPRAEAELRRALTFIPDDPVILEHMGDVLSMGGKREEAAAFFEKAISRGHEKPEEIRSKLNQVQKAGSSKQ
jgi:Flp pilus assembly protein TadD